MKNALYMRISEFLTGFNYFIKIDFHQIGHEVYISEFLILAGIVVDYIKHFKNIFMFEGSYNSDLTQNSFSVYGIFNFV